MLLGGGLGVRSAVQRKWMRANSMELRVIQIKFSRDFSFCLVDTLFLEV
jgi:hypothetical protein